jgi:phage shock protein PspC (stress-responsive transcriptional regulator)
MTEHHPTSDDPGAATPPAGPTSSGGPISPDPAAGGESTADREEAHRDGAPTGDAPPDAVAAPGDEPTVASVADETTARVAAGEEPSVGASAGGPGDLPAAEEPSVRASAGGAGDVPAGDASTAGPGGVPPGGASTAGPGIPSGGGSTAGPGGVPPGGGFTGGSTAAGFPAGGVPPSPGPWTAFTGRRLARSSQRKVIAGVAGGLGEFTGIDPVLFRVLFAVLTLFGGSGILLYVVGWLFMPAEDEQSSPVESLLHRGPGGSNRARDAAAAGALIVAGLVLAGVLALGDARDLALVLIVVGGAFFLVRNLQERRDGVPRPPVPGPPAPPPAAYETPLPTYQPPPAYQPPAYQPPAYQPPTYQAEQTYQAEPVYQPPPSYPLVEHGVPAVTLPPAPPPPPREHSALGMITVSLLLVVLGVAAALTAAGAIDPEPDDLLAVAVGTVGAGLLVGAWFGRARWLTWLGVPLLIALIVVSASNVSLKGGVGDRQYDPQTAAEVEPEYRIGVGTIRLDLSAVDFSNRLVRTKASAGVGNVQVIVPRNADVSIDGRAGIGEVDLLGQVANGTSATRSVVDYGRGGDGTIDLTLDLDVSIGRVEVDRAAS